MPERPKPEVLLALIEHGSRPAATLLIGLLAILWLFAARQPLFQLLSGAEGLRIGSFELRLRSDARSADLGVEFEALSEVSLEQLQLFLIIGREREHIIYRGPEVTEENLRALQEVGLVSEVRKEEDGSIFWRVSRKGRDLHQLIFSQLLLSIRRAAV